MEGIRIAFLLWVWERPAAGKPGSGTLAAKSSWPKVLGSRVWPKVPVADYGSAVPDFGDYAVPLQPRPEGTNSIAVLRPLGARLLGARFTPHPLQVQWIVTLFMLLAPIYATVSQGTDELFNHWLTPVLSIFTPTAICGDARRAQNPVGPI